MCKIIWLSVVLMVVTIGIVSAQSQSRRISAEADTSGNPPQPLALICSGVICSPERRFCCNGVCAHCPDNTSCEDPNCCPDPRGCYFDGGYHGCCPSGTCVLTPFGFDCQ